MHSLELFSLPHPLSMKPSLTFYIDYCPNYTIGTLNNKIIDCQRMQDFRVHLDHLSSFTVKKIEVQREAVVFRGLTELNHAHRAGPC